MSQNDIEIQWEMPYVVRSLDMNFPTEPWGHPVPDVVIPLIVTWVGSGLSARDSTVGAAIAVATIAKKVKILVSIVMVENC
jgi:hypothetical protein